ncbi:MAG: hypothetical protein JSS04_17125 [Proteobacteria bacterium]|nr:hypothetical protein [Pseudomonadota bacterium]
MKLQLVLVAVPALAAAFVGWRGGRFRRRSLYDDKPAGMSDAAYARRERRRHLVRRLSNALLYALAGAALGVGAVLYFRLRV